MTAFLKMYIMGRADWERDARHMQKMPQNRHIYQRALAALLLVCFVALALFSAVLIVAYADLGYASGYEYDCCRKSEPAQLGAVGSLCTVCVLIRNASSQLKFLGLALSGALLPLVGSSFAFALCSLLLLVGPQTLLGLKTKMNN